MASLGWGYITLHNYAEEYNEIRIILRNKVTFTIKFKMFEENTYLNLENL